MNIVAQAQRQQQPCPDLAQLPPGIADRLAAEGIVTLEDWRALGPRRYRMFASSMVRQLDELARKRAAARAPRALERLYPFPPFLGRNVVAEIVAVERSIFRARMHVRLAYSQLLALAEACEKATTADASEELQ